MSSDGAGGFAVCRSNVRAGYVGVDLAWEASGLVVAGSAIASCYEGIGVSWYSHGVLVVGNNVSGAYSAVGTSWGSNDVTVVGNELTSSGGDGWPGAAVNIHQGSSIEVLDNVVHAGVLPAHNPAIGVIVDGNEVR
jgi:hypothetical protein